MTRRKYICDKYDWNKEFDLVDWQLHGLSIRQNYDIKHFLSKYVHKWLPVGELVSRYSVKYPPSCPSCQYELENQYHMLRCPKRIEQRKKLLINLKRFINSYPNEPCLRILLLRKIKNLLSCNNNETINDYERKYGLLIQQQSAIGWEQILVGRFTNEWKYIANDHI